MNVQSYMKLDALWILVVYEEFEMEQLAVAVVENKTLKSVEKKDNVENSNSSSDKSSFRK